MPSVTIDLPDEFVELCEAKGVTPERVLKALIGDLACLESQDDPAFNNGGSDERATAMAWFQRRCW